ncbi:tol-pal system protein YbgF [Magnetococcales bacterium HHB-1]
MNRIVLLSLTLILGGCIGAPPYAEPPQQGANQATTRVVRTGTATAAQSGGQLQKDLKRLSSELQKLVKVNAASSATIERLNTRIATLEKEAASLRGALEVIQHQSQQVQQIPQQVIPQQPRIPVTQQPPPQQHVVNTPPAAQQPPSGPVVSVPPQEPVPAVTAAPPNNPVPPPATVKPKPPESPQAAYDTAFVLLQSGKYNEASTSFSNFLEWFPDHELTDNAQYWVGEIYYVQKQFPEALVAFNQVLVRWPTSDKVPACLLKIGFAFYELGDLENAKTSLSRLIKDFPKSNAVDIAKKRLQIIKEQMPPR